MHELRLAQNITQAIQESFNEKEQSLIAIIHLKIGIKHAVQIDALKFAYSICVKETALNHSNLEVEFLNAQGDCPKCGSVEIDEYLFYCDKCGNFLTGIEGGDELTIDGVEMNTQNII
jgi:hydrogenase nickel insertion protein HypA